jgi:hypothetical protein
MEKLPSSVNQFNMFFIVMICHLVMSQMKVDHFVMLVNKERVIDQLPFSLSTRVTKSPLEIIYSDV